MAKDTTPCKGCYCDFYNGRQNFNSNNCWSLKKAKLVTRWKIGWWTAPTEPRAFEKVRTYNCHHAPGKYALYEKLPPFAQKPVGQP